MAGGRWREERRSSIREKSDLCGVTLHALLTHQSRSEQGLRLRALRKRAGEECGLAT